MIWKYDGRLEQLYYSVFHINWMANQGNHNRYAKKVARTMSDFHKARNATEITSPPGLPYRPYSVLR